MKQLLNSFEFLVLSLIGHRRIMKKVLLFIIFVLYLWTLEASGRERLANEDLSGLYARSIEQVLRLEPEEVDLATAALIISEQWSDMVYGRRYLSQLDDMAYEILERLEDGKLLESYKAIAVINKYLFEELGFESISEASNPNDLFLHTVLDKRRGYCLSLSILYLSLGERLGLPLYGVVVPGHFFVRYDDGQVRFNIETTGKGGYASDEHYIEKFNVPEGDDDSIYMLNLDKIQTLGCFFNNLGNSYSDISDTDSAQRALEMAVDINPLLAESHTNLGNIYLKKGWIKEAVKEYRAALEIKPDDAKTHNNLGNAYFQQEWWNDAISEYTKSVNLDPNFIDAYKNLSSAYCKKEMYESASSWVRQALSLKPEDAGLYKQLGDVYSQMGGYKEAIIQYEKALKFDGDLAEAYYGLGVCCNKLGLFEEEIVAYKEALAIKPDMVSALVNLGGAYFAKQDYDTAIEFYRRAVGIKPEDSTIRYNLGAAYSNKEDYQQAVIEYRKAIEIEPRMGDAHKGLGLAYYKLEKYDLAAEHIKIAKDLGVEIAEELLAAIEDKL